MNHEFLPALWADIVNSSMWEWLAVVLALGYLGLAVRENIWCWACAAGSTAIYIVLFYDVALMSESALNGFYLFMAGYGYYRWKNFAAGEPLPIRTWPYWRHAVAIGITAVAGWVLGGWMADNTQADFPHLDALTSAFAVLTTWMVAVKLLENWLYWFVIDGVSIWLYLQKGLALTALLFVVYLLIVIFGYARWRREYRAQARS